MTERLKLDYNIAPLNLRGLKTALSETPAGAYFLLRDYKLPKVGTVGMSGGVMLKDGSNVIIINKGEFKPGERILVYQQGNRGEIDKNKYRDDS